MCGRFTIVSDMVAYQLEFDIQIDETIKHEWKARYNVSPNQPIPMVRNPLARTLEFMQWGLIPVWAKGDKAKMRLINIRAETIMEKITFQKLMQQGQRCLILADGFYEWRSPENRGALKIPYYFKLKDGKPFVFAGLWDNSVNAEQEVISTCAIITCAPNELITPIHNRMPVILDSQTAWNWLQQKQPAELLSLLKPYPEENMVTYPVGTTINNPAVDVPECIQAA